MKKKSLIIIALIIVLISAWYYTFKVNYNTRGYINNTINKFQGKTLNNKFETKIKSGNLATDYNIDTVLKDIDQLGLNTLNVPVAINIESLTASNMTIDNSSKEKAISLIKKLKGKKINIILEPYPWIANGAKYETEWLPDNKDEFFANWKTKVLKPLIDEVAVPYRVDAFNIATSFTKFENEEEGFINMIDYVKQYYKGLVIYRTSFWITVDWKDPATEKLKEKLQQDYEKKLNNKIFSKVDFISIAAYFELTENDTNTVDNLVSAIESTQRYKRKQNVKQEIKNFYDKWNKPIFFGELGFPITDKASIEPWNPNQTDKLNEKEQANCFEAYRRSFEKEPWNLGFSVFAIGENGPDKRYYPSQYSTEIIKDWYKK